MWDFLKGTSSKIPVVTSSVLYCIPFCPCLLYECLSQQPVSKCYSCASWVAYWSDSTSLNCYIICILKCQGQDLFCISHGSSLGVNESPSCVTFPFKENLLACKQLSECECVSREWPAILDLYTLFYTFYILLLEPVCFGSSIYANATCRHVSDFQVSRYFSYENCHRSNHCLLFLQSFQSSQWNLNRFLSCSLCWTHIISE